jgi:hypothetical protein
MEIQSMSKDQLTYQIRKTLLFSSLIFLFRFFLVVHFRNTLSFTIMPAWESLPLDIRYLFLRTFCAEIIADFKDLGESICDDVRQGLEPNATPTALPPFQWPSAPASLVSFKSAIATCREFNDTILNQIKFDGRSTLDLLEEQQHDNLSNVNTVVHDSDPYPADVGLYYQAAGCFWKNSKVEHDPDHIPAILQFSTRRSSQLLLPHLDPWLSNQVATNPDTTGDYRRWQMKLSCCSNGSDDESDNIRIWVEPKIENLPQFGTIDSQDMDLDMHPSTWGEGGPPLLAEVDVTVSPSKWWVIFPLSTVTQRGWDFEWILVNYQDERMYVGPNASEALVWKGKNVWDMATWAKLKTMKEIEDYGSDTFHSELA